MKSRLTIGLAGEEGAGVAALKALEQTGHRIAMVLSSPGSTLFRAAEERGLRAVPAARVKERSLAAEVRDEEVDLLLNVHSLHVIAEAVVRAPRLGAFNVHPGPLPRYAGLHAPAWAILRGERRHGVTLHWMEAGIDTGAIAYQTLFDLRDEDTALTVGLRCREEGLRLVSRLVETMATSPRDVPRIEQDIGRREYFGREVPNAGAIAWDRPADEVRRFVRAFCYHPFRSPWGHPKARLEGTGREVEIVLVSRTGEPAGSPPGTVGRGAAGDVRVACADDWLRIDLVKSNGESADAGAALEAGARLRGSR